MTDLIYIVVIVSLAILSIYALRVARRAEKQAALIEQKLLEKTDLIEHELSAMMDGAFGMGDYLEEVKRILRDTIEKQMQLEQRDLGNLPYNQAVRMVGQGATVDDLVSSCGLSRSEAELVELLHKKSPPVLTPQLHPEQAPDKVQPDTGASAMAEQKRPGSTSQESQPAPVVTKPAVKTHSAASANTRVNPAPAAPTLDEIIEKMEADVLSGTEAVTESGFQDDAFSSIEKAHRHRE